MKRRSILIVDDMDINREILAEAFKDKYDIIEAENGVEAVKHLEDGSEDIAAVLLDMVMPEMNGTEVLKKMNENGTIIHIPVFIITAENNEDALMEAYNLGAVDVIVKPFMLTFLRCRIENIIELYSHRNDLEDLVNEQVHKLSKYNKSMIEALASLVEFRDCESGEHIKRMCGLTEILMNKVSNMYPEYRLPKSEIDKIVSASVLHDVGKIAISDSILNKPGKLTPEEFEIMKSHTIKGCEILKKMPSLLDDSVYNYSYDIARHHHERWDGRGYPDHLAGDKISIWAQVVSVVDVYDALVSPRVYKNAFDYDVAVKMIMNGECGVFNPKVLKAFELSLDKIRIKHMQLSVSEKLRKAGGGARLLVVDDSEIDRSVLKNILEPDFKTIECTNGYDALAKLNDPSQPKIDGVLLDISMPIIDGFSVLKMLRDSQNYIPVVLMTSEATRENVERGIKYNIAGFLGKPFNPYTVITKIRSIFKGQSDEDEKSEDVSEEDNTIDVDESMAYFAQLKNIYLSYLKNSGRNDDHYGRVSDLLGILLEEYAQDHKKAELSMERINLISKAAYFYDIGRMGIPDEIVKAHKTVDEGRKIYEDHAKFGAFIVRLNKKKGCEFFIDACAEICMHHHERYDGAGYPHKLDGSDITYYTNMTSLCIEFDHLFFKREEYNDRQFDFIIKELDVDIGRFDPDYIELMNQCRNQIVMYYKLLKKD